MENENEKSVFRNKFCKRETKYIGILAQISYNVYQKQEVDYEDKKHNGMFAHQMASVQYILQRMEASEMDWIDYIILFGSCATGKNRFNSDVDILFVTKKLPDNYKDEMLTLKRDLIGLPEEKYASIDPKFMDAEYAENETTTFLNNIRKDGIVIWTRNHI